MSDFNVEEYLCDRDMDETVIFTNPSYSEAFIGTTTDNRAVYDYERMVDCLSEDMSREEAMDFISYNTIRALDYQENAPVIIEPVDKLIKLSEISKHIDSVKDEILKLGLSSVHLIAIYFLLDDLKLKLSGGKDEV